MRKSAAIEESLERISRIRRKPLAPETLAELSQYLASKSSAVAAAAARAAGERNAHDLGPKVVDAFRRFLVQPNSDRGCTAKTEAVKALCAMESIAADVYLAGVRLVQMEGSFGPPVDTAAVLRGLSAVGLVRMRHPEALHEIVNLLADSEPEARLGAVRAAAEAGGEAAVLLLRFRVRAGESDPDVLAACFSSLLAIDPRRSVEFAAGYLEQESENAALALGESRREDALEALKARLVPAAPGFRRTLLLAVALIRSEPAIDYLITLLRDETFAEGARAALAVYRDDQSVREKLRASGALA